MWLGLRLLVNIAPTAVKSAHHQQSVVAFYPMLYLLSAVNRPERHSLLGRRFSRCESLRTKGGDGIVFGKDVK
jgi:hypothetical protein